MSYSPANRSGRVNLLATPGGRRVLFATLYLSEGAPIGYLWWALPTRLRGAGVPVEEVTALTALLVLPWSFKFLWAPLVDTLRTQRWTFRSWILSSQLVMGLALLPLLLLNLHEHYAILVPILVVHAVAAATQDVSIDALAISSMSPAERGAANAWMQAGMLTGRSALGGGALMLGPLIGEGAVVVLLVCVVWSSSTLLWFFATERETGGSGGGWDDFTSKLKGAVTQNTTWLGLMIALIGGAAYEGVGAVAGPFLIDRGCTQGEVGFFFLIPAVVCMVAGGLAGGHLSDRMNRARAVAVFLLLTVAIVWLIALADTSLQPDDPGGVRWILMGLLALLYVGIGAFVASSYAMFMDLTQPELGATQFSAYMGATNGCESWSSFAVGRLTGAVGYAGAFTVMGAASLLAIPALVLLQRLSVRSTP